MGGLTLPHITSEPLGATPAGRLWRVLARAARSDAWTSWPDVVAAETDEAEGPLVIEGAPEAVDIAELLSGVTAGPELVEAASRTLCHGLRLYLEALPSQERVRSAGRVAKLLHLASVHTPLRPFEHLTAVPEEDQASIWDAVLRVLLAGDGSDQGVDAAWLDHLAHLPQPLHDRWHEQLDSVELSDALRHRIDERLDPPPPPSTPAPSVAVVEAAERSASLERSASPELAWLERDEAETQRELPALRLAEDASAQGLTEDASAQGLTEDAEDEGPEDHDDVAAPQTPQPAEVQGDRDAVAQRRARRARRWQQRRRTSVPAAVEEPATARGLRVLGRDEGAPLSLGWRILGVVTGVIVLVALIRVAGRFFLGLRREVSLEIDAATVTLSRRRFLLGREVRSTERRIRPESLASVARERRAPQALAVVGLLVLCLGAFAGTFIFLDGRLAGFERWMRVGLLLVIGGLAIDFALAVLSSARPGRTTLSVTWEAGETVRITGAESATVESALQALTALLEAPPTGRSEAPDGEAGATIIDDLTGEGPDLEPL